MVRSNYDTLTLKLQDGLDQYERYSEQHKEAAFFKELVSCLASEQSTALFRAFVMVWAVVSGWGVAEQSCYSIGLPPKTGQEQDLDRHCMS